METGTNKIKLIIGGDFGIVDGSKNPKRINENLRRFFSNSDLNIINLECPITIADKKFKIIKTGPHIKGLEEDNATTLKDFNTGLVTLANNHILDYGKKGLEDTLAFCKKQKIETVGAGKNLEDASKVFRKTIKGHKLSIINFAENEWSSATNSSAGANPMDLIDNLKLIQAEKIISDNVIVIIHGGHEYYNLPSPRMVKQYRFYADCGADLIVGHHTHCISGFEIYNSVPIYYGLGNLLLTLPSKTEAWYQGLLLEVNINDYGKIETKIHPCMQDKIDFSLSLLTYNEREKVLMKVGRYNQIIQDNSKLESEWSKYIALKYLDYLGYWSAVSFLSNKYFKSLLYKSKLSQTLINKRGSALHLNLMRCEAHADLSQAVLNKFLNKV